eukprot:5184960-Prorocentrum_lima.AAC.1
MAQMLTLVGPATGAGPPPRAGYWSGKGKKGASSAHGPSQQSGTSDTWQWGTGKSSWKSQGSGHQRGSQEAASSGP